MTDLNFEAFKNQSLAAGFDEVVERQWDANVLFDTHTHPFDVQAIVIKGDMWLTHDGQTQHLKAGSRFTLARNIPHAEKYGEQGATYWVARRN